MKDTIKSTNLILMALLCILAIACAENKSTPQGGQDSGGGDTTVSKIEDVEFYYNRVYPLLPHILDTFLSSWTVESFKDADKQKLLVEVRDKVCELGECSMASLLDATTKLVASSQITILRDSPCSAENAHKAASIQELKIGSPICVSFKELQKNPKGSLEKEISAILVHEFMHALGYGEAQADVIQYALTNNFDLIFPNGTKTFKLTNEDGTYTYEGQLTNDDNYFHTILDYFKDLKKMDVSTEYEWRRLCINSTAIALASESLRTSRIHILNRFSSTLLDTGKITEAELDQISASIVSAQIKVSEDAEKLADICLEQDKPKLTPEVIGSSEELVKSAQEFQKAFEKAEELIEKYN